MCCVRFPAMLEATHTYSPTSDSLVSRIFKEPEGSWLCLRAVHETKTAIKPKYEFYSWEMIIQSQLAKLTHIWLWFTGICKSSSCSRQVEDKQCREGGDCSVLVKTTPTKSLSRLKIVIRTKSRHLEFETCTDYNYTTKIEDNTNHWFWLILLRCDCSLPGRKRGDEVPLFGPANAGWWNTVDFTWQNCIFTLDHWHFDRLVGTISTICLKPGSNCSHKHDKKITVNNILNIKCIIFMFSANDQGIYKAYVIILRFLIFLEKKIK